MLVLTRKLGEKIIVSDSNNGNGNIEIQIVDLKNHTVRIGISAPENIKILREEIFNKIGTDEYQKLNPKNKIGDFVYGSNSQRKVMYGTLKKWKNKFTAIVDCEGVEQEFHV